ncbi:MFS transporter [Actinomadura violacea]|uniref:MFS transporter n=1 Tax=Actinomadura violacea TaxID=2819934 RepID=A0ABS3S6J6_9ACTN|nr:MFS transporter [Actinomadura violacea]MBO2464624.1 MFS transporter [Actinomadura violacea]
MTSAPPAAPAGAAGGGPGLRAALASLRGNRPFRRLWLSNVFFFGGVWTQSLVLGWLAFEATHSEFLVAVFTAARLAPMFLGPVAGAFADRHNRVRLLIVACGWATGALAVVASLATAGLLPYWGVVAGGLAIGFAQSPSQPARASLVLELVGRENLSTANALNSMAMNMTQVIGPGLGGALIAAIGAPAALWVSTAWYGVSLLLLLPLRGYGTVVRDGAQSVSAMVAGGFRSIGRNRLAVAVLLVTLAANTLLWPVYQSFMPVFADESLGLDAAGLGALLTCCGVGGLVGSLVIAGLGDFRCKGGVFVVGTAVWAGFWALFALSRSVPLSLVLMGLIGLSSAAFGVLQTTLLLMTTEPSVHGRALGLQELAIGIMPVATLVLGAIAERAGVARTVFGAALILIAALAVLAARVPALLAFSGRKPG